MEGYGNDNPAAKSQGIKQLMAGGGVAKDGKTPKDTRTGCQKKALEKDVKDFHRRFPEVRIVGHNELAAKACPSFDVQKCLTIALLEKIQSLPPLKITAFPDFRHRPNASAVTFGLDS